MTLEQQLTAALNRLAKWRSVFAGWQLGTRHDADPEAQAVRDQRELLMFLRAEVNAVTALLLKTGAFTQQAFQRQLLEEIEALHRAYERKFPGFRARGDGMEIDISKAGETMKGWRP